VWMIFMGHRLLAMSNYWLYKAPRQDQSDFLSRIPVLAQRQTWLTWLHLRKLVVGNCNDRQISEAEKASIWLSTSGTMEYFPEMGNRNGCSFISLSRDPADTTGTWSSKVTMVRSKKYDNLSCSRSDGLEINRSELVVRA
jgi:hypothetical protein